MVDEMGQPEKIYQNLDDESHQLIEEFECCWPDQTIARQARREEIASGLPRAPPGTRPRELRRTQGHFLSLFGISCGELTNRKEVRKDA